MEKVLPVSPDKYLPTGTEINYFFICLTKLWFFSHNIRKETGLHDTGSGRPVHETNFFRDNWSVLIDDKITVNFIRKGNQLVIREVKTSKKWNMHMNFSSSITCGT